MDENTEALGDALTFVLGAGRIAIKLYRPKENFTTWLGLFRERVRAAQGMDFRDQDDIDQAVIRLISQYFNTEALACYIDLPIETKTNYNQLVTALKAVFGDPGERQDFINNVGKTKREKGEKIKAFARRVQTAIETNMPELQDDAVGAADRRRPKELEGINRFVKGIRNKAGKKDADLERHLKYYLFENEERTWQNAITIASRWEMAKDHSTSSTAESSSDSLSDESSTDGKAAAMTAGKLEKTGKRKGKKEQTVATLADQVRNNTVEIQSLKSSMEQHMAECETQFTQLDEKMDHIIQMIDSTTPVV
jgi:hypothetical protein